MADSALTGGNGAGGPVRVLTGLGAGNADQQVITIADSAGNLLGTTGAGLPVEIVGGGGLAQTSGVITATVANNPGTAVTASTSAQVVAAVPLAGNVTFHLVTVAFVGTVVFEASVDGGFNYGPLMAIREDGTGSENSLAINQGSAFIRQYTAALPGLMYFRVRCSAFTSGSLAVVMQPGPTLIEPNPSLAAGTNAIGTVGVTALPAIPAGANAIGTVGVTALPALPAGANAIGSVTVTGTVNTNPTNALTTNNIVNSAASTNALLLKSGSGDVLAIAASNSGAAVAFLKIYNLNVAPTVGTSVPALTIPIPASGVVNVNLGTLGIRFSNGISIAITNLMADSDTTAVAAAQVKALISYK